MYCLSLHSQDWFHYSKLIYEENEHAMNQQTPVELAQILSGECQIEIKLVCS